MKLSYIVTTACGDPAVAGQTGGQGITGLHMNERERLLREEILPAAKGFDEVIVVGRFPEGMAADFPHVTFISIPALRRDRIEAFRQREVGSRWSTGDILVLSADDHKLGKGFAKKLREIAEEDWGILTPRRVHAKTNETLNNGVADRYSPWHCHVYRRFVWAQVPWTAFDTLWVDIVLPDLYEQLDIKMVWDDRLTCYDVEMAEGER